MKASIWNILTHLRDKDLPEWLVEFLDWLRYEFFYPF